MAQALELARRGTGLASPNPYVGAVIVDASGEKVVGRGVYTYDALTHAEIYALHEAGERARGGTLYINLEPCAHFGRTPPCVDEVIAAGLSRVVVGMADPNPLVAGRSLERMRSAGIEVVEGVEQNEARHLNEAFARYIRAHAPLVTLKAGMTLDGKIAPPPESELPTCRSCATTPTRSWSAWAPSSPTIHCSPIAPASRGGVRCCA